MQTSVRASVRGLSTLPLPLPLPTFTPSSVFTESSTHKFRTATSEALSSFSSSSSSFTNSSKSTVADSLATSRLLSFESSGNSAASSSATALARKLRTNPTCLNVEGFSKSSVPTATASPNSKSLLSTSNVLSSTGVSAVAHNSATDKFRAARVAASGTASGGAESAVNPANFKLTMSEEVAARAAAVLAMEQQSATASSTLVVGGNAASNVVGTIVASVSLLAGLSYFGFTNNMIPLQMLSEATSVLGGLVGMNLNGGVAWAQAETATATATSTLEQYVKSQPLFLQRQR